MMGDSLRLYHSNKKLKLRINVTDNLPKHRLLGYLANDSSNNTLKCFTSMKVGVAATVAGDIGVFLLTTAVLEIFRKFCSARRPFIWRGLQALQLLSYPPCRWMEKWARVTGLIKRMQTLSRPLFFFSIAKVFFDQLESSEGPFSGSQLTSKGTFGGSDADHASHAQSQPSLQLAIQDKRPDNQVSRSIATEKWLLQLYEELDKQGITIPPRLDVDEIRRFYLASDGDFSRFLSSIKKTIRWRQKYTLLSPKELEAWGHLIFWHGSDMMQRPTLILRFGLACSNLTSSGRSQFVRAVVSEIEYGVLNLIDAEHPQLTVLMDCEGLSPFGFPIQTVKSCVVLLQDHYPNRLGCLLVIRLPSVARVITQTLFQVLPPTTQQKLIIAADDYQEVLSKYFEELPRFLGGKCLCPKCASGVGLKEMNGEAVGERMHGNLSNHKLNVTSSDSDPYEDTSSLDINWDHVRIAIMGALLLWICVVFVVGLYYQRRLLPQLFKRKGS